MKIILLHTNINEPINFIEATISLFISIQSKTTFMSKKISLLCFVIIILLSSANFISCSKSSPSPTPTPNPCSGVTITVSGAATAANCTSNGTITITASGASAFTYKLNAGGAYQASNVFSNLAAGAYTVFAKSSAGCEGSASVTVTSTGAVSVSAVTTAAMNCVNDGTITVTATGGTGFTYKLNAGGTYQASNVFTGLATGSYTVFAKEAGGCEGSASATVGANNSINVSATSTAATNCQTNGSVTVTATGSTGFTYKLNAGGTYQASNIFNNLIAGNYTAFAKDGAGCENSTAVTVSVNNTIAVNTTAVQASKCSNDGQVTVNASGSTGFTYKLGAGGTYQASNLFAALAAGTYTLFAKDVFGCESSAPATVSINNTAGPLFVNVKNLLAARCVSCHSGPSPAGGRDWTLDCEIVNFSDRINQRAVIIGDMPQGGPTLTPSEKAIITNWINAGAKFTN